ncbi:uncharacterized protein DUF547 [Halospina denitrificans]|uniref:Uncharacterized protein DUF547 n=1 Tax=Halospina denitrificans TaxID=332522 RepID=A0A4V3ER06_9GAMM|nr:DUF547 domain-containing protein [Halospina denitrificans]TDT44148.1 uncharacterized protein DUF547 [Halospina denitrificans]
MKRDSFTGRMAATLLIVTAASSLSATETTTAGEVFSDYQKLLEHYLQERRTSAGGLVSAFDYKAALADEQTQVLLDAQSERLAEFDVSVLDSREKALAFWNNAYNYFMIHQILTERQDGKLVDSVWDYGGRYNPFTDSVFERDNFDIGGQDYSLNQIEKEILLGSEFEEKGWKEARVHFTVNCASVGCPPLREDIYTSDNIEELMTENTRLAFNTHHHLRVEGDTLLLTELFKWYEQDFVDEGGSVRGFIREWADEAVAQKVKQTESIEYIEYDWSLNRPDNFPAFQ